jgi:hypothetical protein
MNRSSIKLTGSEKRPLLQRLHSICLRKDEKYFKSCLTGAIDPSGDKIFQATLGHSQYLKHMLDLVKLNLYSLKQLEFREVVSLINEVKNLKTGEDTIKKLFQDDAQARLQGEWSQMIG